MKAYEVKYGTKVVITSKDVETPPSSIPITKGDVVKILRLDGMYCNGTDKDGNRIYISAMTEVEPWQEVKQETNDDEQEWEDAEERINIIGQNGNTGIHYTEEKI